LIEEVVLHHLNKVVAPDYSFRGIVPRQHPDTNEWEIYLDEQGKGQVPLSASGSGLKTILCVLVNMSLWPGYSKHDASKYIFAFEELENSLHPALLRRLLKYVAQCVEEQGSVVFLTSHSSVAIDMFASANNAQIIHTNHKPGAAATVTTVSEYAHHRGILLDLDVRASDILQSNGIIWVEGPSDRTYVNHWLSLASGGELKEGTHYQCVFYGGKLLAHLSAEAPDAETAEGVPVLRVNMNAAVIVDRDRSDTRAPINSTKQRICSEIEAIGGYCWVTAGREIENYLPMEAVQIAAGTAGAVRLGPFDDLGEVLDGVESDAGRRFQRNKAEFAVEAVEHITLENQRGMLDWKARIEELATVVRQWNRMPSVALQEARS
jgi:hypothetical protein